MLLVATLLTGLLWTFDGPHYLLGFSLLTLHIFIAIPLLGLAVWHIVHYRWILKVPEASSRRAFLQTTLIVLGGTLIWQFAEFSIRHLRSSGRLRRFTGSYETGSFTGQFPQVSWIADRPQPVDVANWRLVITGAVVRPLELSYDQIKNLAEADLAAILDCTGGWYSAQEWSGIPVARLLDMATPTESAKSVTFEAVSGYRRRFGIEEAGRYLLATKVAGAPLSHGHGFPLRLIAPGQRGVYWVKWIHRLQVNKTGKYWQLPLPLK